MNHSTPAPGMSRRALIILTVMCVILALKTRARGQSCEVCPVAVSSQMVSNAAPGTVLPECVTPAASDSLLASVKTRVGQRN
jgi:hypothetical protein